MRTTIFTENGREHLLCFNPWAQREFLARYGGIENINDKLNEGSTVDMMNEAVWMLSTLIMAGDKYAKLEGIPNARTFTAEELLIVCDLEDFANMRNTIHKTLIDSSKREVNTKAENQGNAKTTQN